MILLTSVLAEARRSIYSTRYNKAISRAFLSRARSANIHRFVLQSETRSCIGAETTSEKVSGQCVGDDGLDLTHASHSSDDRVIVPQQGQGLQHKTHCFRGERRKLQLCELSCPFIEPW